MDYGLDANLRGADEPANAGSASANVRTPLQMNLRPDMILQQELARFRILYPPWPPSRRGVLLAGGWALCCAGAL
jgi:hypothetical protein